MQTSQVALTLLTDANRFHFINLFPMTHRFLRTGVFVLLLFTQILHAQNSTPGEGKTYLLKADRVFDGKEMHSGWVVLTQGDKIVAVGKPADISVPAGTETITLPNQTLLPGLIEGHSHLFLHPYNETTWDDQVLRESHAERTARAVVHAQKTLLAGVTTVRDLGTEGADYDDVGLKQAIEKGIIPGPRMIVAGRAIVATGSYGPKGVAAHVTLPQGAQEADGVDNLIKVVREQIGAGADVIKVYADYRWGIRGETRPTFTETELRLAVETAASSGRTVVAHASTAEGMRRATQAGVRTIEHGDNGTPEVFKLMAQKGVALCPTLAAGDAVAQYRGWKKGTDTEPLRIQQKRVSFKQALEAGVMMVMGGDVGVFAHGDNVREMELMVDYGMKPLDVLRSATSVNASVFEQPQLGNLQKGFLADIIAVEGDPSQAVSALRKVTLVMKGGVLYKKP